MCPELNTAALVKLGLQRDGTYQKFSWGTVYPKEYFNPYESATGRLNKTKIQFQFIGIWEAVLQRNKNTFND